MKNNSNLLLAVVIVVAFIFLWNNLVVRRYAPVHQPISRTQRTTPPTTSPNLSATRSSPSASTSGGTPALLHVEGANVTLDSRGARVSSWKIKERNHWIELIPDTKAPRKFPLEMFPDLDFKLESNSESKAVY